MDKKQLDEFIENLRKEKAKKRAQTFSPQKTNNDTLKATIDNILTHKQTANKSQIDRPKTHNNYIKNTHNDSSVKDINYNNDDKNQIDVNDKSETANSTKIGVGSDQIDKPLFGNSNYEESKIKSETTANTQPQINLKNVDTDKILNVITENNLVTNGNNDGAQIYSDNNDSVQIDNGGKSFSTPTKRVENKTQNNINLDNKTDGLDYIEKAVEKIIKEIESVPANSNNKNNDKKLHYGHRMRKLTALCKYGIENVPEHEILESILYFSIPVKDVNPLAHRLIKDFGSLNNVLNADPQRLQQIHGVGLKTAFLLTIMPKIMLRFARNEIQLHRTITLNSAKKIEEYFRSKFQIKDYECCYMFLLDSKYSIMAEHELTNRMSSRVELDITSIITQILLVKPASVIFIHTHPSGDPTPSLADNAATMKLYYSLSNIGVDLFDHIIIAENSFYSYNMHDLQQIKTNINKKLHSIFSAEGIALKESNRQYENSTYENFFK